VVDRQVVERQESDWAVSIQLRRGSARFFPTYKPIDKPFASEQYTEPSEPSSEIKNVSSTI